MVRRLEQVAALVVAAGLAIVSYWLFFSWAGVEGTPPPARDRRDRAAIGPMTAADGSTDRRAPC
ncbi:hypothetical protein EVJ50_12665 [Synechococcus sp. RSCCF101]|uniref:hypothetical protein n=1 Tax=Synechococcus sp. RSCCF101 TaxID=2511069 RepID=UPI001244B2CA|nr:hypothetical protein [Synechococcus sp. RSCCF101]QEY32950.1 hypothetical protein EVJ50_12665 [Synechococcus sp. RSCCF101]